MFDWDPCRIMRFWSCQWSLRLGSASESPWRRCSSVDTWPLTCRKEWSSETLSSCNYHMVPRDEFDQTARCTASSYFKLTGLLWSKEGAINLPKTRLKFLLSGSCQCSDCSSLIVDSVPWDFWSSRRCPSTWKEGRMQTGPPPSRC